MRLKSALLALVLLSFVANALFVWLLPGDGEWIEAVYARRIYPALAPVVAFVPARLPFSLAAVGIIAIIVWALWYLIENIRRWLHNHAGLLQAVGRTVLGWALVGIVLFHGFYLFWGYNYLRAPLEERLGLTAADMTEAARIATSRLMVQRAVDAIVDVEAWDRAELDVLIDEALDRAMRELEGRPMPVLSPLKSDLGTGYLALTGQGGVVNPLTLEAHVNFELPPFQLAFIAAHEKAHLAGFARERDANFVAWYALTRADDPRLQFAGHFGVARYFFNEATMDMSLPLFPYYLMLQSYHSDRASPAMRDLSRSVYNVYMRANRMEAGLADYGEVASLIHQWVQQQGVPDAPQ
jgi:hypothetical protein